MAAEPERRVRQSTDAYSLDFRGVALGRLSVCRLLRGDGRPPLMHTVLPRKQPADR